MKAASPKIKSKRRREKSSIRRLRAQKRKCRGGGERRRASPVTACQKIVDMQATLQSHRGRARSGAPPAI